MSKFIYVSLIALSLVSVSSAMADEVSQSTSTNVDSPDYSASHTSTTTQTTPSTATRETTSTTTANPYSQEVTTKKEYKSVPCRRSNSSTTRETTISR